MIHGDKIFIFCRYRTTKKPRLRGAFEIILIKRDNLRSIGMVRERGLEPLSPKAPDPKSGASANSATLARNNRRPDAAVHIIKKPAQRAGILSGGSCRNRTCNPLIKSQMLCQLS